MLVGPVNLNTFKTRRNLGLSKKKYNLSGINLGVKDLGLFDKRKQFTPFLF